MAVVILNPSCQYGNVIVENDKVVYNEGLNLFDIAVKTKEVLEEMGHTVYITRDKRDEPSDLRTEMKRANAVEPDVLVALHSDATGEPIDPQVGGTTTFYATEKGRALAEYVHKSLCQAISSIYPNHSDRGIMTHWYKLYVLHNSIAPACLTEILFHTNPRERKLLLDADFHLLAAKAIAQGIDNYLKNN